MEQYASFSADTGDNPAFGKSASLVFLIMGNERVPTDI